MIFLFTGPSATGKSTLAASLGKSLRLPIIGERKILHKLACKHGFTRTRYWLSNFSIDSILDEALTETISVIRTEKSERGVILDGSYDRRLPQALAQEFRNEKILIIVVNTERSTREFRMRERLKGSSEEALREIELIDGFKYAAGMGEIMEGADLVIENDRPIDEAVRELQLYLESGGFIHPGGPERM